ncbi:MAG: exodeoxyribonuclease I [Pseudomonadota bacterium]
MSPTLYWHDYETFGAEPRHDRPAQFAGLRTDSELNPIGAPLCLYCQPAPDYLPAPEACLITGILPQTAQERGVCEAEFAARIQAELAQPGTCGVGYNNLRFDDEVTRFLFWRTLRDPYAREWAQGNTRWDLLDTARALRLLRPEGIEWPEDEDGVPSFRLEALTAANGIEHSDAHDALADVQATVALARRLRQAQPRLWDWLFAGRTREEAAGRIDMERQSVVLHVSSRFPARLGAAAPMIPLDVHPVKRNTVIAFDLRHDPAALIELEPDAIRERLYTPTAELPEGVERIPLKEIHLNKAPVLAPGRLLREAAISERLAADPALIEKHWRQLRAHSPQLRAKLAQVYAPSERESPPRDVDEALYEGFIDREDRQELERLLRLSPVQLAQARPRLRDPRLPELLFRYRARNFPSTLTGEEQARWQGHCRERLGPDGPQGGFEAFQARLYALRAAPEATGETWMILDGLDAYAEHLRREMGA